MSLNSDENLTAELADLPITRISSNPRVQVIQTIRDLVEYRELFMAFVTRSLKIRYKQTALGVLWVVLQPLITGVVFSAIFGLITGRYQGFEGLIFFMAGLVPWTSFQQGTQMASQSLETNANLVSKVFFPRMTVPASEVLSTLVDFSIAFMVLNIFAVIGGLFRFELLLWMPFLLLIQVMTAIGLGLFFSIINAQYRDVKYTIPFLLQLAMFMTVLFSLNQLMSGEMSVSPERQWMVPWLYSILSLNPMAGVVETYRAIMLGNPIDYVLLGKGFIVSVLILFAGVRFFAFRERRLVDII